MTLDDALQLADSCVTPAPDRAHQTLLLLTAEVRRLRPDETEATQIINVWRAHMLRADREVNRLCREVGMRVESQCVQTIFELQRALTFATAERVGDIDEWLEWYWNENALGVKAMEAAAPGRKLRKIRTPAQLVKLIVASNA